MAAMDIRKFLARYRVSDGRGFHLADHDPGDTHGLDLNKREARNVLKEGVDRLSDLQERLYAHDRWALLIILQAMDAAGKDSAIKHVMSGVNPQGIDVTSFKVPSDEELDHDFLWRSARRLPRRGHIGIFNRSYYEEVLVVRVHPEFLHRQKLPGELVGEKIWRERFEDINAHERYLSRNGIKIRKIFLNVSKDEQKRRFLNRLNQKNKNWKFSASDIHERRHWDDYMAAYDDMIRHTGTAWAPWFVVPADNKWFTRLTVAAVVIDALEEMKLSFPKLSKAARKDLEMAAAALMEE